MMTLEEKKQIKVLFSKAMEEEPEVLETIMAEVFQEQAQEKEREAKIKSIVKRDFKRFAQTFRDLA